ncbi:MAG: hypothetical protein ABR512_07670 [Desulfopila sp.]
MMIKNLRLILAILIMVLHSPSVQSEENADNRITLDIPEPLIEDIIDKILPLTFADDSSRLEGTITIEQISNLSLQQQRISGHITINGQDLSLVTSVANQDIRLKLGSAHVDFDSDADLRFDRKKQTLYIRPLVDGIDAEEALQNGDIGKAILLFLHGREFPLDLRDIEPILAETADKTIAVNTHIADIRVIPGSLQLSLVPVVEVIAQ